MDILIAVIFFSATVVIGAFSFVAYKIRHRPPPPQISDYEKNKNLYIETGNIENLLKMEEEMEGK